MCLERTPRRETLQRGQFVDVCVCLRCLSASAFQCHTNFAIEIVAGVCFVVKGNISDLLLAGQSLPYSKHTNDRTILVKSYHVASLVLFLSQSVTFKSMKGFEICFHCNVQDVLLVLFWFFC